MNRELKKGSMELILAVLDQPRDGYDIARFIRSRSEGVVRFHSAKGTPAPAPAGRKWRAVLREWPCGRRVLRIDPSRVLRSE